MKRFVLAFALVAVGLLASFVSLERTSEATSHPGWSSGPLLSCPDVDGDGGSYLTDILAVASGFGTFGGVNSNYAYIYDVAGAGRDPAAGGDGVVNLVDDILYMATRFGDECTDLTERQIAVASSAMLGRCSDEITFCPDLRNWSEAQAAGYIRSTQYVPNMGIHVYNIGYQGVYTRMDDAVCDPTAVTYDVDVCQLERPVGLVYTESGGQPDQLIGAWYLVPNPEVCEFFGNPDPESCQPSGGEANEPIGFGTMNTDEDNTDYAPSNRGWHDHNGLCVWNVGTPQARTNENMTLAECNLVAGIWFSNYGWMMHLYNFVPNPVGRFMQWNSNLP